MKPLLLAALFLTGCSATGPQLSPDQRVAMMAFGNQLMAAPAAPYIPAPVHCWTQNSYGNLITTCR